MDAQLHEELFIKSFIRADRQHRWAGLLPNPRRRSRFIHRLADDSDLDERCFVTVPPSPNYVSVLELLRSMGAPDRCYLISEVPGFDRTEMTLEEAVAQVFGSGMGTVISCLPGGLAYYEGEFRARVILRAGTK